MNEQVGFYVNIERCVGCRSCEVACKQWNNVSVGPRWRFVRTFEGGVYPHPHRYFVSLACNHCASPPCVASCPVPGAMFKREEDGVVVIDQDKCTGCHRCQWACPYGAPQYNAATNKVEKCHLCLDRQLEGGMPACVQTCPAQALDWGAFTELEEKYGGVRQVAGFAAPTLTGPSVIFRPTEEAMVAEE